MIFIDNKYTRIYNSIIDRAKSRSLPQDTYTENHHIIPRSLGGNNSTENIATLTAREHFICHWLLTKMTHDAARRSMAHAFRMMFAKNVSQERYTPKSKIYELAKKSANKALIGRPCSAETREKIRQGSLKRNPPSDETRRKLSEAAKRRKGFTEEGRARVIAANAGRVCTTETREKLRQHNLGKTNWKQKGISQEKLTCPYCKLTGGKSAMKHWHFDKCKYK
jgi:5-methylcytosine-specific restriction endonuclease McrA